MIAEELRINECLPYKMFKVSMQPCESSEQPLSLASEEGRSRYSAVCFEAPRYHTTSLIQ